MGHDDKLTQLLRRARAEVGTLHSMADQSEQQAADDKTLRLTPYIMSHRAMRYRQFAKAMAELATELQAATGVSYEDGEPPLLHPPHKLKLEVERMQARIRQGKDPEPWNLLADCYGLLGRLLAAVNPEHDPHKGELRDE